MMRICIDLTSLADNLSGIERYAASLSKELVKQKNCDFVLLFKDCVHSLFQQFEKHENIECIPIPGCNKLIFYQIRLPWIIHNVKADWYLFLAFPVPVLSFKKNMVSTIHDICCWDCPETMKEMMNVYFRISHSIALRKCRAIITISEFSKERIHERLYYPKDKIWRIYCGIDTERFGSVNEKNETVRKKYHLPERYLLSLSTIEPRKNLALLIRAYESLVLTDKSVPPLVLAGRKGWKMDDYLSSIDETVREHVLFTGFVDDDDLPGVYAAADCFIFPSMYEGFGMPPLEAIACGTPVLSSDASSLPEVLDNAAMYFCNNNMEDLKEKLLSIVNLEKKERERLINLGAMQVNKFNWKKEADILYSYMVDYQRKEI